MSGRQQPWAPEAERELVACPFVDGRVLDDVSHIVSASDFWLPLHRDVWQACIDVHREHGSVDLPLLLASLRRRNGRDDWPMVIGQIQQTSGTTQNATAYAAAVRRAARVRAVIDAAEGIVQDGYSDPVDVEAFTCNAQEQMRSAAEDGTSDTYEPSSRVMDVLDNRHKSQAGDPSMAHTQGVLTGWPTFDGLGDGLARKLVVVMGRPSQGKTTLAFSWAWDVARRGGKVFVWSGELDSEEVWGRFMSLAGRVPYTAIASRHEMDKDSARRAYDGADKVASTSIAIDCKTKLTAAQIVNRASRARRELGGLDLVVADHFHLMQHPKLSRGEPEREAMGRSSGMMRDAAKDLGASFMLCAQLSRHCEQRPDKRPLMSDLRECGALEQDAHMIVSPYRHWVYDRSADYTEAELLVRKNRSGPLADVPMRFLPAFIEYSEAAA